MEQQTYLLQVELFASKNQNGGMGVGAGESWGRQGREGSHRGPEGTAGISELGREDLNAAPPPARGVALSARLNFSEVIMNSHRLC